MIGLNSQRSQNEQQERVKIANQNQALKVNQQAQVQPQPRSIFSQLSYDENEQQQSANFGTDDFNLEELNQENLK